MKDNKLLAEYLEYTIHGYGYEGPGDYKHKGYYRGGGCGLVCNVNEWHPDSDWNQLMMVVEKIRHIEKVSLSGVFELFDYFTKGQIDNIEAVYNACVEYIKEKP